MRLLVLILSFFIVTVSNASEFVDSYNCAVTLFEVDATGTKPVAFDSYAKVYPKYGLSTMEDYTDSQGNVFSIKVFNGWLGTNGLRGRIVVEKNGIGVWDSTDMSGNFLKSQAIQNVLISFGCSSDKILI